MENLEIIALEVQLNVCIVTESHCDAVVNSSMFHVIGVGTGIEVTLTF